jgi:hypothetical protein
LIVGQPAVELNSEAFIWSVNGPLPQAVLTAYQAVRKKNRADIEARAT